MTCPCCPRGEITAFGICDTCGVGIAQGSQPPERRVNTHTPRRRQDQDETRLYTDYARTKEDKQ